MLSDLIRPLPRTTAPPPTQSLTVAPLGIAAVIYVALLWKGRALLNDPDSFFHVAAGRWIWAHGAVPAVDPFSFTFQGQPWLAHEWLSELIFAGAYAWLGWAGLVALSALAIAAAFFLLARALERSLGPMPTLLGTALGFMLAAPHLLARPHVLTLPLLVVWTDGLLLARDRGRAPSFWLLPLVTLWANLHGSFLAAPALAAGFAAEALFDRPDGSRSNIPWHWAGFFTGALAASLLTPFGFKGWLFVLHVLRQGFAQSVVGEWRSTDFSQFQPLEVWLLGLLAIGFSGRLRLSLIRLVLLLGLIHLALAHVRNTDFLAFIAPLLLATPIAAAYGIPAASAAPQRSRRAYLGAASVATVTAVATGLFLTHGLTLDNRRIAPAAAVAAAARARITGPVFNAYDFGGYLVFSGIRPFIDGRFDLYGDKFLRTYANAVAARGGTLRDELRCYHITWTLLSPDMPAVKALDHMSDWERFYADKTAVIYRRRPDPRSEGELNSSRCE